LHFKPLHDFLVIGDVVETKNDERRTMKNKEQRQKNKDNQELRTKNDELKTELAIPEHGTRNFPNY
jgi:hypothetical protein